MKPRILMTTTAYPPSTGGVQAHIADLRDRLQRYTADIATLWRTNRTDWLLGTTLRLAPTRSSDASADGVTTLRWSRATRVRMLPWVVSYYGIVPLAARRIGRLIEPQLDRVVADDTVLIHNHRIGREFLAIASLNVARKRGLPFVLTPHHHPKWRGYRYRGWTAAYRAADAVLAHTNAERDELIRLGVSSARIHVIWCAADEPLPGDPARFRARFADPEAPLILFVGQLYAYKGVAELLKATEMLRAKGIDANLAFIGPHTPWSERFFRQQSPPWMRVLGRVEAQEKWDALEAASVVCLPSRHEAFGRIYLEAWSKAKPVIGGRIPAVCDVIEEGRSGLLVTPGSSDELADALQRVLRHPEQAAEMGHWGQAAVAQRFNWPKVVDRVEAAYDAARQRVARRAHQALGVDSPPMLRSVPGEAPSPKSPS